MCISEQNRTLRVARESEALGVHFVPADAMQLVELFGGETGDELDKFARCRWHPGPHGVPILDDCERWFAGSVLEQRSLGDHVGFLLDPIAAENRAPSRDFPFHRAKQVQPGHPA